MAGGVRLLGAISSLEEECASLAQTLHVAPPEGPFRGISLDLRDRCIDLAELADLVGQVSECKWSVLSDAHSMHDVSWI